jgi:esterase/lipase superfamily enzyme
MVMGAGAMRASLQQLLALHDRRDRLASVQAQVASLRERLGQAGVELEALRLRERELVAVRETKIKENSRMEGGEAELKQNLRDKEARLKDGKFVECVRGVVRARSRSRRSRVRCAHPRLASAVCAHGTAKR